MMPSDGLASRLIHCGLHTVAGHQFGGRHLDAMPDRLALRLHVNDPSFRPIPAQPAGVGGLPATLGIEGSVLEEHVSPLSLAGNREDVGDGGVGLQTVVADEAARPSCQRRAEIAGRGPAAVTLALHQCGHGVQVDLDPSLLCQFRCELDGKAEGVMQIEHFFGVKGSALEQGLQALHPLTQGDTEALLLGSDGFGNPIGLRFDLGVNRSQQASDDGHARRQVNGRPQPPSMDHGAADHAPEHIPTPVIGGDDPIREQHGGATSVIGEHTVGDVGLRIAAVGFARFLGKMLNERLKCVRVEERPPLVDHRGEPLEAHAGIDPLLGEGCPHAGLVPVPGDENQVPDLEKAITVLAVRPAVRPPAAVLLAPVVVDLGIGTAGPGWTGGPEVVLVTEPPDPLGRHAGFLPDLETLVVVVVDAGPQPRCFELQLFRQEFPGVGDRLLLEIVAEGEVTQHLEEGQVMAVMTDEVDVHRAKDLLTRGRARVWRLRLTQKVRLELDHTGDGEQRRRIAERDQGGAR